MSVGHRTNLQSDGTSQDYYNQEEIDIADDRQKRQAEEETRSGHNVEGFALMTLNPGSEECLRD